MFMIYDPSSLEVLWLSEKSNPQIGGIEIEIPDEIAAKLTARSVFPDGQTFELITWVGTILTQAEIDRLIQLQSDRIARVTKVADVVAGLVGMNVTDLTELQRWILVSAVFYKLGIISATGEILDPGDWLVTT